MGLGYRFHNFGSNQLAVFINSSGIGATLAVDPGTTGDLTATQATYWLSSYGDAHVTVEPLINTLWSGIAMSPMSYVIQMASQENATLVGTFFSASGVALIPPGTSDAVVSVSASSDPETVGYLLFGTDSMWVDAVEFRGVLQGGPMLVVEGSPAANGSTPETGYIPLSYGLTIQPGPVILGPNGVEQPARNTGTCIEPAAQIWDSVITDETPQFVDIDVSGAGLTRLFVQWNPNGEPNSDLTVTAYPISYTNDSTLIVSANATVQETFFLPTGTSTNHIELDPGKYRVNFSTSQTYEIAVYVYLQRFL